ncbi:hypothetical protein RB653_001883 [Dictyostelium firmibasis]|uniref:Uncharacterized protein n=1 Tax=Dictyostelium firmibasis TaxID=79012 RepID=A0AAN7YPK7_9MYCE
MESVKNRVYKTQEHVHHQDHSVQDGNHPKSLKSESKIIRSDYQLLADHSESWMDAVQQMQTKWEVLANTINNFGCGLYVDNSRIHELSEGFHRLQNLMFPIIKTTKIGIHDNAEIISHHSVDKLKKQNHQMENNRVRADHATHKLDKYRSKSKTNPTTLKKKEAVAEKATIVYDDSYRKYQHDIRDLEFKSVDNLHFSRQLLFDLQDFFNHGFESVHALRLSMDEKPIQEKLHSRFGLLDQSLPPTYEKYHSTWIPKDHSYPIPHGSVIFDDDDSKEEEQTIEETTTTTTTQTTTYEVPKGKNINDLKMDEGTSSSFKRLSVSETNSPIQQKSTYVSSTTTDAGDLSTSTSTSTTFYQNAENQQLEKSVIIPTIINETSTATNSSIISPKIVSEYVYQGGESSKLPSE